MPNFWPKFYKNFEFFDVTYNIREFFPLITLFFQKFIKNNEGHSKIVHNPKGTSRMGERTVIKLAENRKKFLRIATVKQFGMDLCYQAQEAHFENSE